MNLNGQSRLALMQGMPWSARLFVNLLSKITTGSLTLTDPQGSSVTLGKLGALPHADLIIKDWRACGLILRQGDIGFAEALRRDWINSHDLLALLLSRCEMKS